MAGRSSSSLLQDVAIRAKALKRIVILKIDFFMILN
jgi:hypothetical protein